MTRIYDVTGYRKTAPRASKKIYTYFEHWIMKKVIEYIENGDFMTTAAFKAEVTYSTASRYLHSIGYDRVGRNG